MTVLDLQTLPADNDSQNGGLDLGGDSNLSVLLCQSALSLRAR